MASALGDGVLSQPSPEKNLEELRLRIVREAEENFVREAKKLRGDEGEGEVRSYHTASSGQDPAGGRIPPMPLLQGPATSPHQLVVNGGLSGTLQHTVPHQASLGGTVTSLGQYGVATGGSAPHC